MLERPVEGLETRIGRIEAILQRLEPMIVEILTTSAKRSDLETARTELRADIGALRGTVETMSNRLGIVEGRTLGVEAVLRQVPNTWQIIAIFAAVASAIIGAVKVLKLG